MQYLVWLQTSITIHFLAERWWETKSSRESEGIPVDSYPSMLKAQRHRLAPLGRWEAKAKGKAKAKAA